MNVRDAEAGDAAAVAGLWTEAYADAGPEGRQKPYALQEYFAVAAIFRPGAPGRSIAGSDEAEFARLAVADRARRQGIGRALVRGATERARGFGAEAIALWSRPYQTAAHALYESLGWRRAPDRDGADRDGRRWVFVLDL